MNTPPVLLNRARFVKSIMLTSALTLGSTTIPAQAQTSRSSSTGPVDFFKTYKDQYVTPKSPTLVEIGQAQYITIDGKGAPGGKSFSEKIGALYGAAYTVKMRCVMAGGQDFIVPALQGMYWGNKDKHNFFNEPKETWNWKLLIRVPPSVTSELFSNALKMATGGDPQSVMSQVRLESITEGLCVQVLHVGPYDQEPATIAAMMKFAEQHKLAINGFHHEIYLSDPNATPPDKLRTILRQPLKKK